VTVPNGIVPEFHMIRLCLVLEMANVSRLSNVSVTLDLMETLARIQSAMAKATQIHLSAVLMEHVLRQIRASVSQGITERSVSYGIALELCSIHLQFVLRAGIAMALISALVRLVILVARATFGLVAEYQRKIVQCALATGNVLL